MAAKVLLREKYGIELVYPATPPKDKNAAPIVNWMVSPAVLLHCFGPVNYTPDDRSTVGWCFRPMPALADPDPVIRIRIVSNVAPHKFPRGGEAFWASNDYHEFNVQTEVPADAMWKPPSISYAALGKDLADKFCDWIPRQWSKEDLRELVRSTVKEVLRDVIVDAVDSTFEATQSRRAPSPAAKADTKTA